MHDVLCYILYCRAANSLWSGTAACFLLFFFSIDPSQSEMYFQLSLQLFYFPCNDVMMIDKIPVKIVCIGYDLLQSMILNYAFHCCKLCLNIFFRIKQGKALRKIQT